MLSLDVDTTERPAVVYYGATDSVFTSLIMNTHLHKLYWIDTSR